MRVKFQQICPANSAGNSCQVIANSYQVTIVMVFRAIWGYLRPYQRPSWANVPAFFQVKHALVLIILQLACARHIQSYESATFLRFIMVLKNAYGLQRFPHFLRRRQASQAYFRCMFACAWCRMWRNKMVNAAPPLPSVAFICVHPFLSN